MERQIRDRHRRKVATRRLLALLVGAALIAAACGDDATGDAAVDAVDGGAADGSEQPDVDASEEPSEEDDAGDADEAGGEDETAASEDSRPAVPIGPGAAGSGDADESPPAFLDDRIIAADIWGAELAILSAGMGFDGVIGFPDTELETVRAAGGSYY
ncbi:MAG: hypothetical protein AAF081_13060, partial [Actinomycetota bacterium]